MRIHPVSVPLTLLLLLHVGSSIYSHAECLSSEEAIKHIGETQCVSATIVRVDRDRDGNTYLRLCEDANGCGLSAAISPADLTHFKSIERLVGSSVEVRGTIQTLEGRTQIALQDRRQLRPQLALEDRFLLAPKEYEAERRGSYSAGKFRHAKSAGKAVKKKSPPTFPMDVPAEDESD